MANRFKCTMCGKEKAEREFLLSASRMYSSLGKIPVCKDCLNRRFAELIEVYDGELQSALSHFCLNFDLYFDKEIVKGMDKVAIYTFATEYIKKINRNNFNRNKSSLENLLVDKALESNVTDKVDKKMISDDETPFVITREVLRRWGTNKFTNEELETLEYKYAELIKEYPSEKYQERELIKDLCEVEIAMDRAYKAKDQNAYAKFQNLKSEKMAELNVIPSKQKRSEDEEVTLGQLIKKFEEEEPIPEMYPEFEDIDKIKYSLNRYFLNPMRKALGLDTNRYTTEDEMETYESYKEKENK